MLQVFGVGIVEVACTVFIATYCLVDDGGRGTGAVYVVCDSLLWPVRSSGCGNLASRFIGKAREARVRRQCTPMSVMTPEIATVARHSLNEVGAGRHQSCNSTQCTPSMYSIMLQRYVCCFTYMVLGAQLSEL